MKPIDLEFVRNVHYFVSLVGVIVKVRNIIFQRCVIDYSYCVQEDETKSETNPLKTV